MLPKRIPIEVARQIGLVALRSVALLMGLYGSVLLLYHIGLAIVMGRLDELRVIWGETSWVAWGGALLLPAIAVFIFDRRIVRWLIPVPRHECPQCGYALRQLTTSRCPECGFVFGPSADNPPAPPR